MKRIIQIYRSSRKPETYLYVDKDRGLADVPEILLTQFGAAEEVMSMLLGPEQKLARAVATEVLQKIAEQGFYLQMPPTVAELLSRDGSRE